MDEQDGRCAKRQSFSCTSSFLPAERIHCGRRGRACVELGLVPLHEGFARLRQCSIWVPAIDSPQTTSGRSVNDLISLFSDRYPIC